MSTAARGLAVVAAAYLRPVSGNIEKRSDRQNKLNLGDGISSEKTPLLLTASSEQLSEALLW
jgi:hypothetical protein